MDKEDARYQTVEQLYGRRKQVIRLRRKGLRIMKIVELSGLSYPTVRKTIDDHAAGGLAAVKPTARGKKEGIGRVFSSKQETHLCKQICDKCPEQLKMDFALWYWVVGSD